MIDSHTHPTAVGAHLIDPVRNSFAKFLIGRIMGVHPLRRSLWLPFPICERALKKAVLHRKNALFYKTMNGAQVGDLFMTLIHTCESNGVNSFDYLVELMRHAAQVAAN